LRVCVAHCDKSAQKSAAAARWARRQAADRRARERGLGCCRHDRAGRELLVVTLWEDERFGAPRVDHRFTDALKDDNRALVDPGRRWRERRDGVVYAPERRAAACLGHPGKAQYVGDIDRGR
jgi:hypothetical protein